jgi:hypothetical protein
MKTIIIPYMRGIASYCDLEGIKWEKTDDDHIKIYYDDEIGLFSMAFDFGREFDRK